MIQRLFIHVRNIYRIKAIRNGFKILLLLLLATVLYWQLLGSAKRLPWQELQQFWQNRFGWPHILAILVVIILMPFNWLLETRKWIHLMQPVEQVRMRKAFKAVLAGLTVSMFTPNRMGEYGGRILMVSPKNRIRSIFATLVGSMSQWLILVGGGLVGLLCLLLVARVPNNFQVYGWSVFILGVLILGGVTFCYFNLAWFMGKAVKWRLTRRWATKFHENLFCNYSKQELTKALGLSGLRYLVYSAQYFCLLASFGFEMNWIEGFSAILFVFLLQTGLPIPPTAGLIARGSLAVWVFGWFLRDTDTADLALKSAVLASTFTLWLVNVLLPAIVGAFFIAQVGVIPKDQLTLDEQE